MTIPKSKITVSIGDREVILDPANMTFNEASLSKYMENEHVWYDYFGQAVAELEGRLYSLDVTYDAQYAIVFRENKENGCSDKLADAYAKAENSIVELRNHIAEVKERISRLKHHLRAWEKAHDNAQSRGHMIRKEMDKLNFGISESRQAQSEMEARIAERHQ